ncbi:MAG: STAS domain-containing protein [Candidatus Omnitrophica bacterium]|nr:STAS domain-containing protein [Candidatus Omnitrophota bacterium]
MNINLKEVDGVSVCCLKGEINIDTVSSLKNTFAKLLDEKKIKVIINFKDVEYIDSIGMATLAKFSQQLKGLSGELVFCEMSAKLGSIFRIVKFGKVFRMFDSEKQALENL